MNNWYEKRYKIVSFIKKVVKVSEGEISPWYIQIFLFILFPFRFVFWKFETLLPIRYDISSDVLIISGFKFSLQSLINLAKCETGNTFFVEKRNDILLFTRIGVSAAFKIDESHFDDADCQIITKASLQEASFIKGEKI